MIFLRELKIPFKGAGYLEFVEVPNHRKRSRMPWLYRMLPSRWADLVVTKSVIQLGVSTNYEAWEAEARLLGFYLRHIQGGDLREQVNPNPAIAISGEFGTFSL